MKAMVGVIIAILIIISVKLFWPSNHSDSSELSYEEDINIKENKIDGPTNAITAESESSQELNTPSDDEKIRLMTAEYGVLEQERKNLKRHIARLKHEMWGLKFVPEKAKKISMIVLGASKILKNPDMLGAFSSVEGIKDEIAKVKFAEKSLQQVDEMIIDTKNSSEEKD